MQLQYSNFYKELHSQMPKTFEDCVLNGTVIPRLSSDPANEFFG